MKAWALYLAAALAVTAGYTAGPLNAALVFNAVGASAVVAILVGARLSPRGTRLPWYCFALGQATFTAADFIAYNYTRLFGGELPFPSIADAAYLCVFPSLIAGLILLIRRRSPGREGASLIDALIVTVGIGALSWVLLIAPVTHDAALPLTAKLVSVLYPLGDLLLMGVVVRLAMGAGHRPATFHLLGFGIGALLLTDAIYGYLQLHGLYDGTGNWLDAGWLAFYALLGAAALHPSMARVAEPQPDIEVWFTRRRLALLATAMLIAPGTRVVSIILEQPTNGLVLPGATILLSSLVLTRLVGIVRRHEEAARREAILREAGEGLAGAGTPEAMDAVILDAARRVAGVECEARLYLMTDDRAELALEAATDVAVESLATAPRAELTGALAQQLSVPGTVAVDTAGDGLSAAPVAGGCRVACLAPVLVRGELHGVLMVFGTALPLAAGREALAAQVALALESVALTADLVSREARFSSLVRHASDVITVVDADGTITYVSDSVERVLGYAGRELAGTRFADLVHADDAPLAPPSLAGPTGRTPGAPDIVEFRLRRADGSWATVETVRTDLLDDPSVAGVVLTTRDVSERKAFEAQLAHQAFHDAVTGLPNRALFGDRVEHATARQRRSDSPVAVLFLDLDDFKAVNDSLGHAAGDALLREVGERLAGCVRSVDTAARLGGDEFAILLDGLDPESSAAGVAERVLQDMAVPFMLDGRAIPVHASVGVALSTDVAPGLGAAQRLLRNADVAMYVAKEQGKSCFRVYQPGMRVEAIARLDLKADLQEAIHEDQFILHYQPIIDLDSGAMTGVEALVRWEHPTRGMIPPDQFISLTEETGLIVPLGRRIMMNACEMARVLQRSGELTAAMSMSVNISAKQLQAAAIVDDVRDALEASGIDPSTLVLELTESVMMDDAPLAVARLHELRALGVRIAVDDFGTGYSSLNYIRNFPVDILKVDRSFVRDINEGAKGAAIAEAILELASTMNLRAVAEGIEDASQLERLRELNCGLGQGYHLGRPMTADAVQALVAGYARGGSLEAVTPA
jgi:diguanylate cyclase (GGDEF)-like protein/PAS domain S-box-containing protein